MKVYNTLTNKIEEFIVKNNKVTMYVCGPTVYDDVHVGNMRPPVFFDFLRRYLEKIYKYEVLLASNVTDVDDKIINKALKEKISERELSSRYEHIYFQLFKTLGCEELTYTPHATDYISGMVQFIEKLIEKDYAYIKPSGVYFRVNKIKDYGILSNQQTDELEEGVRIELKDKEDPKDFALWKFTDVGIMFDAPFGKGRPGWHTECAVMIEDIYKEEIDIHGGGIDLIFPHHENEIAQSMALYHHHLARYFIHVGRINLGTSAEKMSKSLGNLVKAKDAISKYTANVLRYFLLINHYRANANYDDVVMAQYSTDFEKLKTTVYKKTFLIYKNRVKIEAVDQALLDEFKHILDNDLNTPNAFTLMSDIVKGLNKEKDLERIAILLNTLNVILDVFGFIVKPLFTEEDVIIHDKWETSRQNKDYTKADEYRDYLQLRGIL